jgi:hypothetical protein
MKTNILLTALALAMLTGCATKKEPVLTPQPGPCAEFPPGTEERQECLQKVIIKKGKGFSEGMPSQ